MESQTELSPDVVKILVGNKSDLSDRRQITQEQAQEVFIYALFEIHSIVFCK